MAGREGLITTDELIAFANIISEDGTVKLKNQELI